MLIMSILMMRPCVLRHGRSYSWSQSPETGRRASLTHPQCTSLLLPFLVPPVWNSSLHYHLTQWPSSAPTVNSLLTPPCDGWPECVCQRMLLQVQFQNYFLVFFSKKSFLSLIMSMFMSLYIWGQCSWKPAKAITSPGAGVMGGCGLPNIVLGFSAKSRKCS